MTEAKGKPGFLGSQFSFFSLRLMAFQIQASMVLNAADIHTINLTNVFRALIQCEDSEDTAG